MIVELVGFSSSGKTTLLDGVVGSQPDVHILELLLRDVPYQTSWETPAFLLRLDLALAWRYGVVRTLVLVWRNRALFGAVFRVSTSLRRRIALLRSLYRKLLAPASFRGLNQRDKVVIQDEGLCQAVANIYCTDTALELGEPNLSTLSSETLPDLVLFLPVSADRVLKHLKQRRDRNQWQGYTERELAQILDRFESILQLFTTQLGVPVEILPEGPPAADELRRILNLELSRQR